jgi:hypothetical protein
MTRTRPYGISVKERGWNSRLEVTITEEHQDRRHCDECDGTGFHPDGTYTDCPTCAGAGLAPYGEPRTEIRGVIHLDSDSTEAVRWLDGTLVEELEDENDRLKQQLADLRNVIHGAYGLMDEVMERGGARHDTDGRLPEDLFDAIADWMGRAVNERKEGGE